MHEEGNGGQSADGQGAFSAPGSEGLPGEQAADQASAVGDTAAPQEPPASATGAPGGGHQPPAAASGDLTARHEPSAPAAGPVPLPAVSPGYPVTRPLPPYPGAPGAPAYGASGQGSGADYGSPVHPAGTPAPGYGSPGYGAGQADYGSAGHGSGEGGFTGAGDSGPGYGGVMYGADPGWPGNPADPAAGGYGPGPAFGPGGYGPGGYGPGGYGPGGYGPGGYGPGGYGSGGYGPGGYGSGGYGSAAGYGSDYGASGYGSGGYGDGGYGGGGYGGYPGGPGYGPPGDIVGGPGPDRPRRRSSRLITYVVVAALAAGIGAGAVLAVRGNNTYPSGLNFPSRTQRQNGGNDSASSATIQSVDNAVSPGIADVISTPSYQSGTLEGTGMVIHSNGLVLTNNHVIEGTGSIKVKIADDPTRIYTATVVGTDATDDVALLKIQNAPRLHTVPLGNSRSVRVGQAVVALGNAEGQDGTPTVVSGTVTSMGQSIQASDDGTDTTESLHGMIQTNAPIVAGDSGGALASTSGQVIGMNTAALSAGSGQGGPTGYAIPINRALSIASLISSGHTTAQIQLGLPAFLGVTVASSRSSSGGPSAATSPQQQLSQLQQVEGAGGGLGGSQGGTGSGCVSNSQLQSVPQRIASVGTGTLVGGVLCGTPADTAGMTAGAVITSIDRHPVSSPALLTRVLTKYRPGTSVTVAWVAATGQQRTSSVRLTAGPAK